MSIVNATLGAEDFSFYQQKVPGLFFWLGTRPVDQTAEEAASNGEGVLVGAPSPRVSSLASSR